MATTDVDPSYASLPLMPTKDAEVSSPTEALGSTDAQRTVTTSNLSGGGGESPCSMSTEENILLDTVRQLQQRQSEVCTQIEDLVAVFDRRKKPLWDELEHVKAKIHLENIEADRLRALRTEVPPGPRSLRWVEGDWFTMLTMLIIILNFVVIALELQDSRMKDSLWDLEQACLLFYVVELVLKVILHQKTYLLGPVTSERLFRWLDLLIVVGGVVDQWVTLLLTQQSQNGGLPFSPAALRMLRVLRVARLFRLLKALYLLMVMDLSWTDGKNFEWFTTCVIMLNAMTMGLELDVQWKGWYWVNIGYLLIYTFEMLVKLKRHKMSYFTSFPNAYWNWLDTTIVIAALAEMLAIPAYKAVVRLITGDAVDEASSVGMSIMGRILRIFRLLRVVRMYRLMASVKALKKLCLGIADAMQGTIWVIIFTFLVLYILAIVFTTLVGKGTLLDERHRDEAKEMFGSVGLSLFMLFKLMNDDQSVVSDFTDALAVKVLFMVSMVVLNWVMLATLTSVVTGHMHASAARADREEQEKSSGEKQRRSENMLINLFKECDKDGSGFIDDAEFSAMLRDPLLRQELVEATGLSSRDLFEIFAYLSHEEGDRRVIWYQDFITKLRFQGEPASERTVFRLEEVMRASEHRMHQRFESLTTLVQMPVEARRELHDQVTLPGPGAPKWATRLSEFEAYDDQVRRDSGAADEGLPATDAGGLD